MLGLLTYLPTTAYLPQYFFLLAFFHVLFRDRSRFLGDFTKFRNSPAHKVNWNFLIVLVIILLSTVNRLIHWDDVGGLSELVPYFFLLIPSYFIAISFTKADAKVLVTLIAFESLMVVLESVMGVSTFDTMLTGFSTFEEGSFAYFSRPLGISASSSHIATKLFLAWLMLDFYEFKNKMWLGIKILLLAGILLTFNRSVLLSLVVYIALKQLVSFFKLKYKLDNAIVGFVAGVLGLISVVTLVVLKGESIINQITRNTGKVELTGREYVWADFMEFISRNLVFGNNSVKLWLDGYHAHNSFIEVIATNGVFIALLYFILIGRNIRNSNWYYVVAILVFGLTQYAFFWGLSLFDILFWVILFQIPDERKESNSPVLTEDVIPLQKQLID